jgi:hypothetical protein
MRKLHSMAFSETEAGIVSGDTRTLVQRYRKPNQWILLRMNHCSWGVWGLWLLLGWKPGNLTP